jgi:hypothetical protein
MKIQSVRANNQKKAFEIKTYKGTYEFPYAKLGVAPTTRDKIVEVSPDRDFGNEAFTYKLQSGKEGTIHIDSVLEYNQDPAILRDLLRHKLTVAARKLVEEGGYSKRALTRRLGTSSTQFYRILDLENTTKSLDQLVTLVGALDYSIELKLSPRSSKPVGKKAQTKLPKSKAVKTNTSQDDDPVIVAV